MKPDTKAAIKYFLSKDLNRIFYLNLDLLTVVLDLNQLINNIKKDDLHGPTKQDNFMEDMIICTAMETEFLKYVGTKYYYQVTSEAVKKNGLALRYVSSELKGYREIVLEAVVKNRSALKYASSRLQNDPGFILQVVPEKFAYS